LQQQGQFTAALEALRRGHDLGSRRPDWPYASEKWVEQVKPLAALEARLPPFLKGEARPADAAEASALALMCRGRKGYAAAARFYDIAFSTPKWAGDSPQTRYNAATAALLAAAGRGDDAAGLAEPERAHLRQQALDWLQAGLAACGKLSEQPGGRPRVRDTLGFWQKSPDLAAVREAEELAELPQAERQAWGQLWADVAALLERVAAP
jgi:hypothetical protein